ncbi:hypothetical protein IV203_004558 [Nitzschia inconspicua]|uniref:Uncharacterized protein n=1 Tax=Nitzschia inconspicua TaxID=303405 RepID=A0A9K3L495_9STRA|nr:hypothetical protein IV203_004558 [Nitzschia inconspicua]
MPQQQLFPAASSPPGRRRPSSGTTCPGAPTKKKIPDTSPYRHGDDWLVQYFETNETNCPSSPMESAWRPQPRRQLFPEDDHERDDQPSFEDQPQPQPRRRLFWDDDLEEEGQN